MSFHTLSPSYLMQGKKGKFGIFMLKIADAEREKERLPEFLNHHLKRKYLNKNTAADSIMIPTQICQALIPWIWILAYIAKWTFQIRLRILKFSISLGYLGRPKVITMILNTRGHRIRVEGTVMMEWEEEKGKWGGTMVREWNGRTIGVGSILEPLEGARTADTLILVL